MVVLKAQIVNSSSQALLEVPGTESFFVGIVNNKFVASVGDNSGSSLRNRNAKISFDIGNPQIVNNPLANKVGADKDAVELAFLIRLDLGLLLMYVDGKLAAAAQARERQFSKWGDTSGVCNFGGLTSNSETRNKDGPVVVGSLDTHAWVGDLEIMKVYEWTVGNSVKHAAEASSHQRIVDVDNQNYNGEVRLAVLDNEHGQTVTFIKDNTEIAANNGRTNIVNGIVSAQLDRTYVNSTGTSQSQHVYKVNARQFQAIGTHKNTPLLSGEQSLTVVLENRDREAPTVDLIKVINESDNNAVIQDDDIITLTSSADVNLLIEVEASDNSGHVEDIENISLSLRGETLGHSFVANTVPGETFKRRFTARWSDFYDKSLPANSNGDYFLTITGQVRDAAGNKSASTPLSSKMIQFRTNDTTPPVINNVTCTESDSTIGSHANDNLQAIITLNNTNKEKTVRFKVEWNDNNHRARGPITTSLSSSPVYPSGPVPRSSWASSSPQNDGAGNYSAVMSATYDYDVLKVKNDYQYRFGNEGNVEELTFHVADLHGNEDSVTVQVKIIMIDDERPSIPQVTLINADTTATIPSSILLQPDSDTLNVLVNVSAGDHSNILANKVNITISPTDNGVNDIHGLLGSVSKTTGDSAFNHNFQASIPISYSSITRPFEQDVTYKFSVTVEDIHGNSRTRNNAASLTIKRQDLVPPTIEIVKRYQHSVLHNMVDATFDRYSNGIYNTSNVNTNGSSGHDLLFRITDLDAVTNMYIQRSQYILASASNPIIDAPVYSDTEIALINNGNNLYEPSSMLTHNYDDLEEAQDNTGYSRGGSNKVYYQFWRVSASDRAGNLTQKVIPFRVNKVDNVAPGNIAVSLKRESIKDNQIINESSDDVYITHTSNNAFNLQVLSSVDVVRVSFKVSASDNDEIEKVSLLQNPSAVANNSMGFVDGFYTTVREYGFNSLMGSAIDLLKLYMLLSLISQETEVFIQFQYM